MHIETITLEVAVQASAADTENLRGAQAIAVTHLQNLLDVVLAHFVKRKRTPVGIARQLRSPMLQMFREIADVDEIAVAVMHAVEITFSSSRTFPGHGC